MKQIRFKNYIIQFSRWQTLSNCYGVEWKFNTYKKDNKNLLTDFRFLIPAMKIDLLSADSVDPSGFFEELCLSEIKKVLNNEKRKKSHYIFEYKDSIFIKKEENDI